jgi:hypothetical protein
VSLAYFPITHTVVETSVYLREAGKLMSEAEREEVVTMIARDPEAGDVIAGTGGFRKIRSALRVVESAVVPASFTTSAMKQCPYF